MSESMPQAKHQGKNTYEVLQEAVGRNMDQARAAQFFNALVQMIKAQKAKPVQIGNTVFLLLQVDSNGQPLPDGEAEVHGFSVESPQNAMMRYKVLPNTARQLGYRKLSFVCPTSGLAALLGAAFEKAGLQTQLTGAQATVNNKPVPILKQEVML